VDVGVQSKKCVQNGVSVLIGKNERLGEKRQLIQNYHIGNCIVQFGAGCVNKERGLGININSVLWVAKQ
jgi:hypothetical protein